MAKNRRRNVLGLHTVEEQTVAFQMAKDAYEKSEQASQDGDMRTYFYCQGYLAALTQLAIAEGQQELADSISRMKGLM
jgi:hypothetical protein